MLYVLGTVSHRDYILMYRINRIILFG